MTYLRKAGNEYLENGESKVRVRTVCFKPSPLQEGRTLRVMEVVQIMRLNPSNPIVVGNYLSLSFPNDKLNATRFQWNKRGEDWQESQVPIQISDQAVARIHAGKN